MKQHLLHPLHSDFEQRRIIRSGGFQLLRIHLKIIEKAVFKNTGPEIIEIVKGHVKQIARFEIQRARVQLVFETDDFYQPIVDIIVDRNFLILNPLADCLAFCFFNSSISPTTLFN